MALINHFLPDLPPHDDIGYVSVVDKRMYSDCLGYSSRRPTDQRPQETPLFGAIINENYQPPADNGWLDDAQEAATTLATTAATTTRTLVNEPQVPVQENEAEREAAFRAEILAAASAAALKNPQNVVPVTETFEEIFAMGRQDPISDEFLRSLHQEPFDDNIFQDIEDYQGPDD